VFCSIPTLLPASRFSFTALHTTILVCHLFLFHLPGRTCCWDGTLFHTVMVPYCSYRLDTTVCFAAGQPPSLFILLCIPTLDITLTTLPAAPRFVLHGRTVAAYHVPLFTTALPAPVDHVTGLHDFKTFGSVVPDGELAVAHTTAPGPPWRWACLHLFCQRWLNEHYRTCSYCAPPPPPPAATACIHRAGAARSRLTPLPDTTCLHTHLHHSSGHSVAHEPATSGVLGWTTLVALTCDHLRCSHAS